MKFFLIFAIALFTIAHATYPVKDYVKDLKTPVCYYKVQKCCYKYKICDEKVKEIKYYKPIEYKKCEEKCAKVPKTVWKQECKDVAVYEKPQYCPYGECKPVKKVKKECCDKPVTEYVEKCQKVYKTLKAYKIYTEKVKYVKYCPKAECGKYKAVGKIYKPKAYTNKYFVENKKAVVHKKPADMKEYAHYKN